MSSKKNIIIPNSIEVQIKDEMNQNLRLANILCHLNIYIDELSWYTLSYIPTDSLGKVILTSDQIINRTELKHHFSEHEHLNKSPVKFDFYIIGNETLLYLMSGINNYLKVDERYIKEDLKLKGFTDSQISIELLKVLKKQNEDKRFHELLLSNENKNLNYSEEKSKIKESWDAKRDYKYDLKLQI